jgi:chemotaxis signal transduction protein
VYRLAESEIEPPNVLGGEQPAHVAGIGRPPGALLILLDLKPILER